MLIIIAEWLYTIKIKCWQAIRAAILFYKSRINSFVFEEQPHFSFPPAHKIYRIQVHCRVIYSRFDLLLAGEQVWGGGGVVVVVVLVSRVTCVSAPENICPAVLLLKRGHEPHAASISSTPLPHTFKSRRTGTYGSNTMPIESTTLTTATKVVVALMTPINVERQLLWPRLARLPECMT